MSAYFTSLLMYGLTIAEIGTLFLMSSMEKDCSWGLYLCKDINCILAAGFLLTRAITVCFY